MMRRSSGHAEVQQVALHAVGKVRQVPRASGPGWRGSFRQLRELAWVPSMSAPNAKLPTPANEFDRNVRRDQRLGGQLPVLWLIVGTLRTQ